MRYYHSLLKHITPLNLILTVVLLISLNNLFPFIGVKVEYRLPEPVKKRETIPVSSTGSPVPSLADFGVIAERNPFNPDRIIPEEKDVDNLRTNQLPAATPSFALYGTIITEERKMAILEDRRAPSGSKGRRKNTRVLKVGDELSGFVLKKISADQVILSRGEEEVTVPLYDPNKPVSNERFRFPTRRRTR